MTGNSGPDEATWPGARLFPRCQGRNFWYGETSRPPQAHLPGSCEFVSISQFAV